MIKHFDRRAFWTKIAKGYGFGLGLIVFLAGLVWMGNQPWSQFVLFIAEQFVMLLVIFVMFPFLILSPLIIAWGNARNMHKFRER